MKDIKGMSYDEYVDLIEQLLSEGKSTGPNQSESLTNYSKLNAQRMSRIHKTTELLPEMLQALSTCKPQHWTVFTEGWCGDAANNIPVMDLIAKASGGKITLNLLLRDENLDEMDQYLTNGARSIPKLIVHNADGTQEKAVWGPRPEPAQHMMMDHKANPVEGRDIYREVQQWYNTDKTQTLQRELVDIILK